MENNKTPDPSHKSEEELNQKTQDPTGFTESYWNDKRAKLKKKYPDLMDEDLQYQEGNDAELMKRLQKKLGKTEVEIRNLIDML